MEPENKISKSRNYLLILADEADQGDELRFLKQNFCGTVVYSLADIPGDGSLRRIYVCGDISRLEKNAMDYYIVSELSRNFGEGKDKNMRLTDLGKVPVCVSNAGVFFPRLFDEPDYFHRISSEHQFQELTESTKPGKAFRKGIYLTEVVKEVADTQDEILRYRFLRCSSNLSGPTDNFRDTDRYVMGVMNEAVKYVFERETTLNHVLAQIYENKKKEDDETRESKARIKAHSDKTKDMPGDGLIAFCTFYDSYGFRNLKPSATNRFDWCYKDVSGLTRLHFRLKSMATDESLAKEFSVVLYPGSVFIIPLSTNRLYTHEIRPSMLNHDKIPTRMGYVARCSSTKAVFRDGQAYIDENGVLVKLGEMTEEGMVNLKDKYREENATINRVEYDQVLFSMNSGDYLKPVY